VVEYGSLALRGALGRTALSIGWQRALTLGGTYAMTAGGMTAINRTVSYAILGSEEGQMGVGYEFLANLAFMGAGSLATRGFGLAFEAGWEARAMRNLAWRGGAMVLAEGGTIAASGAMDAGLRAALDLEKRQLLQTTFARFLNSAGPLGASYAAIQTLQ